MVNMRISDKAEDIFVPDQCERLVSSSGYVVNKTCATLLSANVTSLVCLRDWLK